MSEIKTEIKQNADGSYTITDAHSTSDVVRWLLTQDSKETVLYLLGGTPQRTWVGLTGGEVLDVLVSVDKETVRLPSMLGIFARAIEAKLKEKNHA